MFHEELAAREIEYFASLSLPDSCSFTENPGVTRWGFSEIEREAHSHFRAVMESLGLTVVTDAAGNTIATYPGTEDNVGALGCGSHLDSVFRAGKFDGIAGVVAAMLIARHVVEEKEQWRHPLRFVVFSCEEGARFGQACLGSRLATGLSTAKDVASLRDAEGVTAEEAMRQCGLRPDLLAEQRWRKEEWAAFLELHIEQGPRLDSEGKAMGVVDVISGSTRLEIELQGVASHSGGTPMHLRRDALAGAAEILLAAEDYALDKEHAGTRITCGKIAVEPGGITTIPGRCVFAIDIRDTSAPSQQAAHAAVEEMVGAVAKRRGLRSRVRVLSHVDPEELAAGPRIALRQACEDLGASWTELPSGASHDAQIMANLCPTGMLFIPSLHGGVSHSPAELSRVSDLVEATKVLHAALARLDQS